MRTASLTFETIRQEALRYLKPADFRIVEQAYALADQAHRDQFRKTGEPYIQHPLAVCQTLIHLKMDPATLAAAFLHDVVEDTPQTLTSIRKQFGWRIATLVDAVTKLDKIEQTRSFLPTLLFRSANRQLSAAERRVESLRKMLLATSKDVRVIILKLADRLHNMETLGGLEPEKQQEIARETLEIYAPIAYRLGIGQMKGRLEDLAFQYLYPTEYKRLASKVKREAANREGQVERVRRILLLMLQRAGIQATINARVKHLYSLFRKLERYQGDMTKIYDLVACRIIVDSVEECYQVLGLIHSRWKPYEGRVKDYIASPKPNGYQSIHTTVRAVEDRPLEIQIRTRQMHEQAEYGIAAHWQYSEQKGTIDYLRRRVSQASNSELTWVNELARWQREAHSFEDFDRLMKIDFFGDRIFVYTPKGEVIDLPVGSTAIDFAYAIHSEIGNHLAGAKADGKMIRLEDALHSGSTVELIVQKRAWPTQDWLKLAKTRHARAHIRRALRRLLRRTS